MAATKKVTKKVVKPVKTAAKTTATAAKKKSTPIGEQGLKNPGAAMRANGHRLLQVWVPASCKAAVVKAAKEKGVKMSGVLRDVIVKEFGGGIASKSGKPAPHAKSVGHKKPLGKAVAKAAGAVKASAVSTAAAKVAAVKARMKEQKKLAAKTNTAVKTISKPAVVKPAAATSAAASTTNQPALRLSPLSRL